MPISNCAAGAEQFESSPRCPCGVRESQVIVLSEDISSAVVDSLYLFSHLLIACVPGAVFTRQNPKAQGRVGLHRGQRVASHLRTQCSLLIYVGPEAVLANELH